MSRSLYIDNNIDSNINRPNAHLLIINKLLEFMRNNEYLSSVAMNTENLKNIIQIANIIVNHMSTKKAINF